MNKRVLIDWLAFTSHIHNEVDMISLLGLDDEESVHVPRGLNGYTARFEFPALEGLKILYGGRDDMGIHVIIPGSCLGSVVKSYYENKYSSITPWGDVGVDMLAMERFQDAIFEFLTDIANDCKVTRLDISMDDFDGVYTPLELYSLFSSSDDFVADGMEQAVTAFRKAKLETGKEKGKGASGDTVYFGSRTSSCFLRVYDKRLEQISRGKECEYDAWVRWEFELKGDYATTVLSGARSAKGEFVDGLLSYRDVARCFWSILNKYFRVIVRSDSNISRCPTTEKWLNFVDEGQRIQLFVGLPEATLERKLHWFLHQVAPTLSTLVLCTKHGVQWVEENLFHWFSHAGASCLAVARQILGADFYKIAESRLRPWGVISDGCAYGDVSFA